jgi:hypothetical protein
VINSTNKAHTTGLVSFHGTCVAVATRSRRNHHIHHARHGRMSLGSCAKQMRGATPCFICVSSTEPRLQLRREVVAGVNPAYHLSAGRPQW